MGRQLSVPRWTRALVTGASSGIGEAIARALAADGSDLILVARREPLLHELAEELTTAHGVGVEELAADLLDPEALRRVEQRVASDAHPVDLLVNNAGFGSAGPVHVQELEPQLAQVGIHVRAPLRLSRAAAARMSAAGHGGILNVSSVGGFQPLPTHAVYAASKAWLRSFSEALHAELKPRGVHVTVLCPGFVRTPMLGEAELALPGAVVLEADAVAAAGLHAVARNRPEAIPGTLYQALVAASTHTPRSVLRRITATASAFLT